MTLVAMLIAACGSDDNSGPITQVSKLIGPSGGTVELADGGKVEIPAGALPSSTTITVTEVKNPPPLPPNLEAAGKAFAFEPHGLVFERPVKVTLPIDGAEADVRPMKLDDGEDTTWQTVVGADKVEGKLELETSSFSIYQPARPRRNSGVITLPDGATMPEDAAVNTPDAATGIDAAMGVDAAATDAALGTDASTTDASAADATSDDDAGSVIDEFDLDGDGFANADDPAPNDPMIPGDFSSVEAILADPRVTQALEELNGADPFFLPQTETNPPDVSGYYRKADNAGTFTRTSNGAEVGRTVIGLEHADVVASGSLDSKVAGFIGTSVVTTTNSSGQFLRGTGNSFTAYSRDATLCTLNGGAHRTFGIRTTRGQIEPVTLDIVNVQVFSVTVATEGTLTTECAGLRVADTENVNGWAYWTAPRDERITENELLYLCVDEGEAFLPNESWTRGFTQCTCNSGSEETCE